MHFPIPALLGMAFGISEAGLGILKRSRDDAVDADKSTVALLWVTIGVALSAAVMVIARVPRAAIGGPTAFWLGCVLFAVGLTLRWYSIVYLGRFFTVTVAIHSRHEIIDTGPFRLIRHPTYAGALLAFLGLGLCLGNWLSLALVMLPIAWAFGRRMSVEEAALASALGAPYTRYMQRTKRLVPYIY
jgi:protein-S-isoprenylcysteine O-methyltransferase